MWDPALRLFHWALVVCVVTSWGLGRFGPSIMTLHFYFGYAVIALLTFRLIWGLFGPASARFSHFLYGPGATLRYAAQIPRRAPSYWPGHNPVGALSVFALLAVLTAQAATGLFADPDDFINVGPLADMVSREAALGAASWHYRLSLAVLALVGLHLAAIAFYRLWKGEDLVRPMITGRKAVRRDRQA
nr:cytochrome b/b6 domain-containing protein [Actibacterium sp. MT2.3-13A]